MVTTTTTLESADQYVTAAGTAAFGLERINPPNYLMSHLRPVRLALGLYLAYLVSMAGIIRLFVEHPMADGQSIPLSRDQAHYLFGVMRLKTTDTVLIFNGRDGEWQANVTQTGKRGGMLHVVARTKPLICPPDLWLLFAPIKKARADFIVEKATEMGAARIIPVQTEFTNADRIRRERLQAHAIEAAEQCGGTFVPQVAPLVRLNKLMEDWPTRRQMMFCDEALAGERANLPDASVDAWAILIGPEGGFSSAERTTLSRLPHSRAVSLGPRILRADTAVVAAMTLWQNTLGDWV